jgi:hypothetical protein
MSKETKLCDEKFCCQHFFCDKMVYNTYCDIPKEDSVTKVYGSLHLGKLCRGREGLWAGKRLGGEGRPLQ